MTQQSHILITSVDNDGSKASYFSEQTFTLNGSPERFLSDQISAENFRLRTSDASYSSSWHVAGDPTLLIILTGTLQIECRSGDVKQFSAGQMFIANDYLEDGTPFDDQVHGHRAQVLGEDTFSALHLKLEKR